MGIATEKMEVDPTPPSECVKAVDKGVRREIDGKATNKGVSGESMVDSLKLKATAGNSKLSEGMGRRSRWRAGEGMLLFFSREVEVCGRGEPRGDAGSVLTGAALGPNSIEG
jgi:hypothetical protein